jgi:hypothetical protein
LLDIKRLSAAFGQGNFARDAGRIKGKEKEKEREIERRGEVAKQREREREIGCDA